MLFEEFTNPIIPERQEPEEKSGYSDPTLSRTVSQAAVKYPYYKTGTQAFMKYASRAIQHSEEADQEHQDRIDQLDQEVAELKQTIAKLQQR